MSPRSEPRFSRTRPCRSFDGKRIIVTRVDGLAHGKGVTVRPFRLWSPLDWGLEVWDWWRVRRHF